MIRLSEFKILLVLLSFGTALVSTQEVTCGGLLNGDESGVLNYKLNEVYNNNERCLWTIRAGQKSTIRVQLNQAAFQVCALCDFITIFTVNSQGQVVLSQKIFEADGVIYNVTGPLMYISFTSNSIGSGKGFSLTYEGVGEDVISEMTYSLHYYSAESGQFGYPEEPLTLFPANEFLSFVIKPPVNGTISLTVQSVDNGYSGIYCDRNILSVFECDLGHLGFRLRYCRTDLEANSRVTSPQPLLLTFYSSVAQVGKGFNLSWNSLVQDLIELP